MDFVTARHLWLAALPAILLCASASRAQNFDLLDLEEITSGLNQPIGLVNAGDGSNRLFVVEQAGMIRIMDAATGAVNAAPFLDITARVKDSFTEQGLLGLAFHPDYAENGFFYVNYTRDAGAERDRTVIARFQVSPGDPDVADPAEVKLMEVVQDAANHNGGDLHFGPDGFLYIALGDGGSGDDVFGHAQNIDTLKGTILRIDVDGSPAQGDVLCGLVGNYGIPEGNPFHGQDGCDEIWSYGLRNPWRFSFDRVTGDMFIGDVGQNRWEEIDFEPAGTAPPVNYGWSCREGNHDFPDGNPCVSAFVDPILEYSHTLGCAVTGGYRYRGSAAAFDGFYFYGDFCSDRIWLANDAGGPWVATEWPAAAGVLDSLSAFGEDEEGELYVADRVAGSIYRIDVRDGIFEDGFETTQ